MKLAVTSHQGREAVVAGLDAGEFFGDRGLGSQLVRFATVIVVGDCTHYRAEKALTVDLFREEHGISERLLAHLLSRNIRFEGDLVDQLFSFTD